MMTGDSQYRWLGPEKGVVHLAAAAVVNAVWDLYAKAEGKPLWKLLADLTPEQLIACVPFRYITDALTRAEALEILKRLEPTKAEREASHQSRPLRRARRARLQHRDEARVAPALRVPER